MAAGTGEGPDMEDLLDSALEDFDNLPRPKVAKRKAARRQEPSARAGPSEEDFMKIFDSVGGGQGAADLAGLEAELERLAGLAQGGGLGQPGGGLADTLAKLTGGSNQPSEAELQVMSAG
jgi:hypothetical protein